MTEPLTGDRLVLQEQVAAVRSTIADQIAEAGGATQWLALRTASGVQLTASEAPAWLDLARGGQPGVTADEPKALAEATSVAPWKGSANPSGTC